MNWPTPTAHGFAIVISEIAWCAFAFAHPEIMDHMEGTVFPTGATAIAGGLAIAKGVQNKFQGGSTAPNQINKPQEAKDGTVNQ